MEDHLAQESLQVLTNDSLYASAVGCSISTALLLTFMIIRKLPYILYRDYPEYGYLTDNRNFGYDTASRSCVKVGELLLSKSGSIFYSVLSDTPLDIDIVLDKLCSLYPNVSPETIRRDATVFYKALSSRGFIYWGAESDYANILSQRFSYTNKSFYELNIEEKQANLSTYQDTFGGKCHLSRVHIDISSRCNENCIHCYIPKSKKCSIMSEEMFDSVFEQCKEMNVLNLTISGGEPMLNPSLNNFLLKCRQANFSVNLLSNLTLLTDDLLDTIEHSPLLSVQTSLYAMDADVHDSITHQVGSFQKTLQAIQRLHEKNIPLQINCPIMKQNKFYYREVLNFAKTLNIEADSDYFLFGCYDSTQSNLSCRLSIDEVESVIKEDLSDAQNRVQLEYTIDSKHTDTNDAICPVCKSSLCISNTGNVYPCEGWQSLSLGNLSESTLQDIWENAPLTNHLRNLRYNDFHECKECQDRKYCNTCLIMNANEDSEGNYHRVNSFMCSVAKMKKCEYEESNARLRHSSQSH